MHIKPGKLGLEERLQRGDQFIKNCTSAIGKVINLFERVSNQATCKFNLILKNIQALLRKRSPDAAPPGWSALHRCNALDANHWTSAFTTVYRGHSFSEIDYDLVNMNPSFTQHDVEVNGSLPSERKESVILSMVDGFWTIVTKRKLGPDII